jgi:hypothetical protein
MLDQLVEKLLALFGSIPPFFLEEGSPNVYLVRAMFALMFLVAIVFVIALWLPRWKERVSGVFTRKR